ncbi:MAG: TonB-dependent receptor, partial [Pseudomonadota bacterium]
MEVSTAEKALSLNLVRPLYGTIAEIGAGQEVARWFFKVGGAAGTIAKSMSAFDMSFSDVFYGKEDSCRYVVESRVRKMI